MKKLLEALKTCHGLGGGTISELLAQHKGSLSRPLLLFCLRDSCTELLDYSSENLKDEEYILAGVLFGVRDGWLKMPRELRNPILSNYISYRMSAAEHMKQPDDYASNKPPCPQPLRTYFSSVENEWSEEQNQFALDLAKRCHWSDCIQTKITLSEGEYPNQFERNGLTLILPGSQPDVVEEIKTDQFIHRLGQLPLIDTEIEEEWRQSLPDDLISEAQSGRNSSR